MITKLIQELVGLAVEKKGLRSETFKRSVFLSNKNAPSQLQAAIDKIKGL